MQPATQHARQRKTHGSRAKPRTMVAHRKPHHDDRASLPSPSQAEGLALRTVARLCADSATPSIRTMHRTYMDGFIAALQSAGMLADQRAIVLRNACHGLLGGQITLEDYTTIATNGNATDPTYLRAVVLARRAGMIDCATLSASLDVTATTARCLIEHMQADGVLADADMFGVHTVHGAEVAHG